MTLAARVEVFTRLACDLATPAQNATPLNSTYTQLVDESSWSLRLQTAQATVFPQVPYEQCLQDPIVQSKASKLQTVLLTTMGVLSAITTGWWGRFGERHGRLTVLSFSAIGLLATEIVFFVLCTGMIESPQHRQLLLLVAPILDGLLGGYNTIQATVSSYVSDCTSDGSRANIFARFHGVFFIGIAIGPEIGALLIRLTGGVEAVFFTSICLFVANFFLICFILPESLTKAKREQLGANRGPQEEIETRGFSILRVLSYPMALILPLRVFLPRRRPDSKRWDWSFPALAVAQFGYFLTAGMYSTKYLYADHTYSWNAEKLSYFITGVGACRALHLLIILPFILRTFKRPVTREMRTSPEYPHILAREMHFDVLVAKVSLLLDALSHILVLVVAPSREALFIIASYMTSFGGGANPSLQSLALCLSQTQDLSNGLEVESEGQAHSEKIGSGEVLGAVSFLMATGMMILGPILFGLTFSATVAFAPKTIFGIAAVLCCLAFLSLSFVRPYRRLKMDIDEHEQRHRGRSRSSKDLRSPESESP